MKNINFVKDILPHLIAVIVFLVIIFVFFSPQLTGNKALNQHDVFQGRAAGQELADYREKTGEEGLWLNSMFSGMPGYLVNVGYKDTALSFFKTILTAGLPNPASYVFLSLLCYYIMLLCFGVRPYLAIAGALIFGLTTFNIISVIAGHNSKLHAIAYMPLVIAGIHLSFNRKLLLGGALTLLALALELKANHLQMTYYLLIITVVYGLIQLIFHITEGKIKEFGKIIGVLIVVAGIALIANLGRIWTVYEYGNYSIRGKSEISINPETNTAGLDPEYAFRYSNGIYEPLVLFVPNILGGQSQTKLDEDSNLGKALKRNGLNRQQIKGQLAAVPTYWGQQPLTAPYYVGVVTLLLMVIGIIFADNKTKSWLLAIIIIGVVLSWGKNFESLNFFLFDYLPGYNKFRSVTFAIIISIFGLPLLGMIGLNNLIDAKYDKQIQKKLLIAGAIVVGFLILLFLISTSLKYKGQIDQRLTNLPDWFLSALKKDRKSLLQGDILRGFFFSIALFAVIFFHKLGKLSYSILCLLVILIVTVDMVPIGKRFLANDSFQRNPYQEFTKATEADNYLKQVNTDNARVVYLPNPFNDAKTSFHHASIGGYHGAKIRRYQELIDQGISNEINEAVSSLRAGETDLSDLGVLNMLNTKYLIAGPQRNAVIANNQANGHAWMVKDIKLVNNPTEELLETVKINTKTTAIIDNSKFEIAPNKFDTTGTIELLEKSPAYLKYTTNNSTNGLAVFSEIFYEKGWKAYIDSKEQKILRANFVLRALEVPQGQHEIEFKFEPKSYMVGSQISSITGFLIVLIFLGALGYNVFVYTKS